MKLSVFKSLTYGFKDHQGLDVSKVTWMSRQDLLDNTILRGPRQRPTLNKDMLKQKWVFPKPDLNLKGKNISINKIETFFKFQKPNAQV